MPTELQLDFSNASVTHRVVLGAPTLEECQQVRIWRNDPDVLPMLRTRRPITEAEQAVFFRDVVRNVASNHRYYSLLHGEQFIGLGGLTHLDPVPREGEISLILGPQFRGRGLGMDAVSALRAVGFGPLGLTDIVGECFTDGPAYPFWSAVWTTYPPFEQRVVACRNSDRYDQTDADRCVMTWRWRKP